MLTLTTRQTRPFDASPSTARLSSLLGLTRTTAFGTHRCCWCLASRQFREPTRTRGLCSTDPRPHSESHCTHGILLRRRVWTTVVGRSDTFGPMTRRSHPAEEQPTLVATAGTAKGCWWDAPRGGGSSNGGGNAVAVLCFSCDHIRYERQHLLRRLMTSDREVRVPTRRHEQLEDVHLRVKLFDLHAVLLALMRRQNNELQQPHTASVSQSLNRPAPHAVHSPNRQLSSMVKGRHTTLACTLTP